MKNCHNGVAILAACVICLTGCASVKDAQNTQISPVYVTNTKKFTLLSPDCIGQGVDATQLLSGRFGENEFTLLTYTQADENGIFLSLYNDFGVSMGSLLYDGVTVTFDSSIFPKKLKAEYIVADLQFAYYSAEKIQEALADLGLGFTEEVADGKTVRRIMNGSKVVEEITITADGTLINNLLRNYEYNLQEAAE